MCTCMHMVHINMFLQTPILTGKCGCLWGEGHREVYKSEPNTESFISSCLFPFVSARGKRTLRRPGLHWFPISVCPQAPHGTRTGQRKWQGSEHGQSLGTGVCLLLLHQPMYTQVNKWV